MITNTSFDAIKPIKFGKATFIGQHRAFKLRFKTLKAELILKRMPRHFHRSLLIYKTSKDMTFIACIDHQQSAIWPALDAALIGAEADYLRMLADAKEFGAPLEIQIELPF